MNDFIRILRDPDPNAGGGGAAGAGTQVSPANDIPKTKEEWDKLAETDPKRWISLTQPRMDQAIRESREWKQKAADNENRLKNVETELVTLRKGSQPAAPAAPVAPDPNKPFSRENMPQNDADWDRLFIEDPKLATDLRVEAANQQRIQRDQQTRIQEDFSKTRKESAKELWDRHPDMFEQEMEADGTTPKKDGQGKLILKIDPKNGGPILDLRTEKGKLFDAVYNEDTFGFESSKIGPRLVMLEMERRLVAKGNQQVHAGQQGQPGSQQSQGAAAAPDQRGTLPGGVQPPVTAKVSFASDEEKAHVERAVQRGVYKSLEEYCQLRDGKNTGIVEENRTPKFG